MQRSSRTESSTTPLSEPDSLRGMRLILKGIDTAGRLLRLAMSDAEDEGRSIGGRYNFVARLQEQVLCGKLGSGQRPEVFPMCFFTWLIANAGRDERLRCEVLADALGNLNRIAAFKRLEKILV